MKHSVKHLLGTVAVAALLAVAACDDSDENEAAQNTSEEMPAADNVVPMTSEPGRTDMADGTAPSSSMPGSTAPSSDMSMGEEAAAEGTDAETIAGTGDEASESCAAAADALGVWTGKPYDEAEESITGGEGVATVRVIRPGDMVTKDFRPDRLNVELDGEDTVTKIYCG
ncbi:MAG: I78 family peptidase inhibitor [Parvibaculum sp.]